MEDVRKSHTGYVPRQQQFNHMLDTAYDEILVKKAKSRRGQSTSSGNHLYESFRPVEYLSAKSSIMGTSPSMSEDEDEEAVQRRLTLERLHAEERGRANRLLLQSHEKSGSGTGDTDSEIGTSRVY